MLLFLVICAILVGLVISLLFSTLTYSLRDFVRNRLAGEMDARGLSRYEHSILDHTSDLIFITATLRLIINMAILIGILGLLSGSALSIELQYLIALLVTGVLTFFCSVLVPHTIARHAPEQTIILFVPLLHVCRLIFLPANMLMHSADRLMARIVAMPKDEQTEEVDQEILQAVEQGEQRGVVDEQEREMIESVIEFRDTTAGEIMTPRPEIVGLVVSAKLDEVKACLEESGHSRIPVYENILDTIVGILYARDLLKHLGQPPEQFDMRSVLRPALYVPETKPLRDLLQDFKLQKIHIAIVLDEFGGTAGLVTIEDVLEELVGEITDEHEPAEPAMLKKIDDSTTEADARIGISELNRLAGLNLPEEAGFETLGGFVSLFLGHIGEKGETFKHQGHIFTVLDAEPQRVNRVKIQLASRDAPAPRE